MSNCLIFTQAAVHLHKVLLTKSRFPLFVACWPGLLYFALSRKKKVYYQPVSFLLWSAVKKRFISFSMSLCGSPSVLHLALSLSFVLLDCSVLCNFSSLLAPQAHCGFLCFVSFFSSSFSCCCYILVQTLGTGFIVSLSVCRDIRFFTCRVFRIDVVYISAERHLRCVTALGVSKACPRFGSPVFSRSLSLHCC